MKENATIDTKSIVPRTLSKRLPMYKSMISPVFRNIFIDLERSQLTMNARYKFLNKTKELLGKGEGSTPRLLPKV